MKSGNSLVGATACMVGGILSHHHELGLKAPVGITCFRGFLLLGEAYRLTISLRLHAIQMVRHTLASAMTGSFSLACTGRHVHGSAFHASWHQSV